MLGINDSVQLMTIMNDEQLLAEITIFLDETKMPPTRFGRETMGDGSLIKHLQAGRSPSLRNAEKIVNFIRDRRSNGIGS